MKANHERRINVNHTMNARQGDLRQTLDRPRERGGAVVFEDYPGALEAGDDGEVGGHCA